MIYYHIRDFTTLDSYHSNTGLSTLKQIQFKIRTLLADFTKIAIKSLNDFKNNFFFFLEVYFSTMHFENFEIVTLLIEVNKKKKVPHANNPAFV